jgi:hypothetical protein
MPKHTLPFIVPFCEETRTYHFCSCEYTPHTHLMLLLFGGWTSALNSATVMPTNNPWHVNCVRVCVTTCKRYRCPSAFFKLSTTPWRHIGEWRYSSTHSLTSALDGGKWSTLRPPALPPGKSPRYPLDRRLGGPQSWSGRGGEEKNSQPQPAIET